MSIQKAALAAVAVLLAPAIVLAQLSILKNGSMELGPGPFSIDPHVPANWTMFGLNVERSDQYNLVPPGAGHALKAFGDSTNTLAGAYQIVLNISAGQSVTGSVQLFSPSNDKLRLSGQAGLVLEFLNTFGGIIQTQQVYVLDANSPADTWIPAPLGPFAAPANTAKVRLTCKLQWGSGGILGAAYWDDAELTVNGGPNQIVNGDFETAGNSTGQSPYGIDFWTGFNDQQKSSDVAKDGLYSVRIGTSQAYSGLYQDMQVLSGGDHLLMTAYVWNPESDPLTADAQAGIKLEFEANGQVPPPVENLAFSQTSAPDTWTFVDLNAVVPSPATIARVVCIYTGDGNTTGEVNFDSAWAERSSAPGVNQLLNASFESGSGGQNGIDNWTEFNTIGVSQCEKSCFSLPQYHDGDCAARATGQAVAGLDQEIPVVVGENLHFYAYLYTPSSNRLTGPGLAGVKIEWVLGNIPPGVDIGGSGNTIAAGAPTNTWLPLSIDYTMPPGSNALARFTNIVAKNSSISGHVYFDECRATVLNLPPGGCRGDMNCDGLIDFADIDPFVAVLSGGPCCDGAGYDCDVNGDGTVNFADIDPFVALLSSGATCP